MTSRVRCSCGRIYDPVKHAACPDCGAESAVESVVVAEKVKPPVPPDQPVPSKPAAGSAPLGQMLQSLPLPVYIAAGAVVLLLLFLIFRHREPGVAQEPAGGGRQDAASEQTSPAQSSPAEIPSGSVAPGASAFPSNGVVAHLSAENLNDMIAKASPNATIRLTPGLYQGGVVLNKPVRIVGDGPLGQVAIQTEGKEGLSVRAKGVVVQNVLFMSNGIGELPAVSIADGAELELDTVKIQSGSAMGVSVGNNASLKAQGCTFNATNGTALRINQQGHASLTQCTFSEAKSGLVVANGGAVDLHACAFERLGLNDANGSMISITGDKTQVNGEDCHFNGNGAGINATDNGSIVLSKCTFKDNARSSRGGPTGGVFVLRNGAHGELRDSSFTDGSPYAVNVMSAATLVMENTDISGTRTAGIAIGEQNGAPAKAQIKQSHFSRSAVGIGVFGGSSAEISDSECRQNNEGIVVMDKGSRATLTKTSLVGNRDHGLYVYGEAEAEASDSTIQGNARGAQSGAERKGAAPGGTVVLERCRVANNQVFGVGAAARSQLILNSVTFEGNGKTNIHRESGAVVQTDDGPAGTSEQTSSSATPGGDDNGEHQTSGHRNKRQRRQTNDDDARRIIRHFFPRP